jgi:predicted nucleotidyltransferase
VKVAGVSPAHYRRTVIEALIARLLPISAVRACFEGGSAATGRLDDFSDIDLYVVAPLSSADSAFEAVEAALAAHGIEHSWRVEPPPFPDTAQRFYFLADAPRFFAVDCVVASESGIEPFLERERHGEPLVYFDRSSKIRARPVDRERLSDRRTHRWRQLQGAVPLYSMLVEKELARGRPLDALGFYQAMVRALLEVFGHVYRPERFDFGWRYVESELPEDARALLAHYAYVADEQALRERAPQLAAELARRLRGDVPMA